MKDDIEKIIKYLSEKFDININLAALSIILTFSVVIYPILKAISTRLVARYKAFLLSTDLEPFFYPSEVKKAIKTFIRTRFQNVNPGNFHNLYDNQAFTVSQDLIHHFKNTAFTANGDDIRYYIVLADAGMGKTTFMINLYYHYKKMFTWFGLKKKYDILLLPLGDESVVDDIVAIKKESKNTILLLDAFDEVDIKNIYGESKMEFLLSKVSRFKEVVITCRTHYFKTTEEEPNKTGLFKLGPSAEEWKFGKFYISPFSDSDVLRYIRKSIPFFNVRKRRKAKHLLLKYHDLQFRPMLVSHLKSLINISEYHAYNYLLYEYLVGTWVDREAKKHKGNGDYKSELYKFSMELAKYFIQNKTLQIKVDDIVLLAQINNINLNELDLTSRSLLNRNNENMYKFSHKSIFEYFAACLLFKSAIPKSTINFDKNDLIFRFYNEMVEREIILPVLEKLDLKHNRQYDAITKYKMEGYLGCRCFSPVGSQEKSKLWVFNYQAFKLSKNLSDEILRDYPKLGEFFNVSTKS